MNDSDLLNRHFLDQSRGALEEIVRRHIDLVYATALRETGDHHLAEDVTQAVFHTFMRRAPSLSASVVLSGWFFRATIYAAADARKVAARRRFHERKAVLAQESEAFDPESAPVSDELRTQIQQAIAHLPPMDRDVVVLRYLRGLATHQVAAALGTSEIVARKRISRALNRLRKHLRTRGALPLLGLLTLTLKSLKAQAAPACLAESMKSLALPGASVSPLSRTLTQHLERPLGISRIKYTAIIAACMAVAVLLGMSLAHLSAVPVAAAGSAVLPPESLRNVALGGVAFDNVVFNPTGSLVLTGTTEKTLQAVKGGPALATWNVQTGRLMHVFEWAAAAESNSVRGDRAPVLEWHQEGVEAVAFSPDGRFIASGASGKTGTIRIWDVSSGLELRHWESGAGPVASVTFSPDGTRLLSLVAGESAKLWQVESAQLVAALGKGVASTQMDATGHSILTQQASGVVVWDTGTLQAKCKLELPDGTFSFAEFSPDGREILTACSDKVRIWDAASGNETEGYTDHQSNAFSRAHFSPDYQSVVTVGAEKVKDAIFNVDGSRLAVIQSAAGRPTVLQKSYSSPGLRLASTQTDDPSPVRLNTATGWTVELFTWRAISNTSLRSFGMLGDPISTPLAIFSPDGKKLLVHLNKTQIWDAQSGAVIDFVPESGAALGAAKSKG